MKLLWLAVLTVMIAGCAPSNVNRYNGSSEAYVDLKPYSFSENYVVYNSPEKLIKKIHELGGPQKEFETNSEYSVRTSSVGLSAVLSEIKDYQIKFDQDTGKLQFRSSMEDAQGFGFRPNRQTFTDYDNAYYTIWLPEVERFKGEYIGQNAYGATANVNKVELDRVYIVLPKVKKVSSKLMFVSMISDLNISASDYKAQKNDLRLAITFLPEPSFVQLSTRHSNATLSNKREATVNNYFLSAKLAEVSIVNIKTNKIISSDFKMRFKTH